MTPPRRARPADLPAIAAIERDALAAFDPAIRVHALTFPPLPDDAFAEHVAAGQAWVTEEDGAPAAFIALARLDGDAFIAELSVRPDRMRRGHGRALLRHACAAAAGPVTLTTFRDVPFNAPWYAREGFSPLEPCADRPQLAARLAAERAHWDAVAPRLAMIRRARHG